MGEEESVASKLSCCVLSDVSVLAFLSLHLSPHPPLSDTANLVVTLAGVVVTPALCVARLLACTPRGEVTLSLWRRR